MKRVSKPFFVQSFPVLFLATTNKRIDLHRAVNFGGRYIYPDKHADKKHIEICSIHMDSTAKNVLIRMAIMTLGFGLIGSGTAYAYFVDGTIATLTEVRIPFTAENSNAELIGNMILQSVIVIHGFPAYILMDIVMELMFGIVSVAPKLIENEFRKLDQAIENKELTKPQVYATFKNIATMALDAEM